ncbi:gamma-D-glutamyl-{L}-meso-diaminopimelate peptidase I Metallo peptidase. MEROPS family M14C [Lentibacillus persicus]|uniref:Gamma-D-glutamyl-(L)-meso-diaminopimelate peptidase I Metallo peptidase. MEROPS family M14C n=1 Tax=Lentibacillus persicus TaxID=640948 RepID=A0A1I1V2S0_9BACI|nr:M14 family metallopeptidase [Lentibacillus persicus]SFD77341.1 gamma-D-glutamyl-{L}-meso-diaminopimelate peptidase I Metallo peptidase. MEROPS family M14C [Lentibacillus persicus]
MEVFIRPNDSFWYYSELFDIPLDLIVQSNPDLEPSQLAVGQLAQIPGYMADQYQISSGDTFWNIAIARNLPVDMLQLVNPNINPEDLQIGQQIVIPQRVRNLIITDFSNYTFDKFTNDVSRLLTVYPFIVREAIGTSVMGKEIVELRIGTGSKHIHVNGSFHANEWITTPVIMRFLNDYVLALTNGIPIRGLNLLPYFFETTLSLVPMVNPDGVNLVINGASAAGNYEEDVLMINNQNADFSNWKANIKGVDLNNQYPARWEMEAARKPDSPQPRDYPGPHPLSEPESLTMAELAENRNFSRVNAFHTQGEVIYWGFEGLEPPIAQEIVNEYSRVSGYQPIRYVDSYAGYKDWFIQEFRRPGFTIELGTGVNPLPFNQFEEIYQESLGLMLANLYLP